MISFCAAFIPVNFALSGLVYGITRQVSRALNMLIIDYSRGEPPFHGGEQHTHS